MKSPNPIVRLKNGQKTFPFWFKQQRSPSLCFCRILLVDDIYSPIPRACTCISVPCSCQYLVSNFSHPSLALFVVLLCSFGIIPPRRCLIEFSFCSFLVCVCDWTKKSKHAHISPHTHTHTHTHIRRGNTRKHTHTVRVGGERESPLHCYIPLAGRSACSTAKKASIYL